MNLTDFRAVMEAAAKYYKKRCKDGHWSLAIADEIRNLTPEQAGITITEDVVEPTEFHANLRRALDRGLSAAQKHKVGWVVDSFQLCLDNYHAMLQQFAENIAKECTKNAAPEQDNAGTRQYPECVSDASVAAPKA